MFSQRKLKMKGSYRLFSKDVLTKSITTKGIETWVDSIDYIQNLPYGRNANRKDLQLVVKEKKGTCSSKHAFLKKLADYNNIPNVELILGIYKMNNVNTPKIGDALTNAGLSHIPEAHCYLQIEGNRKDITTVKSDISKIEKDIIMEMPIRPEEVVDFKVAHHKDFLEGWIKEKNLEMNLERLWSIREKCIENLAK